MYFDININEDFDSIEQLDAVDCSGFCLTFKKYTQENISIPSIKKSIYSRLDVEYSTKLDPSIITKYRKYNIICIETDSPSSIPSIIKLQPDLIRIKMDVIRHIKKSVIRNLVENGMFIEMRIADCLYNSKDRVMWLNACRRILKFGGFKSLVISTGAKIITETRSDRDIYKMMNILGLSDDRIKNILNNSEILLRAAAMKRYSINGAISNSLDQGKFKNDFVINNHKR